MSGVSRGFLCALGGVGLTLLAWYGPWAWPAWPAFVVIDVIWGSHSSFAELSYTARSIAVALLIAVNVGVWAALLRLLFWLATRARRSGAAQSR
jgi:hypothetical protein